MAGDLLFKPKAYPARKPTDTSLVNGRIHNPPRMSQIGGLNGLHKVGKNLFPLKKPGGTV